MYNGNPLNRPLQRFAPLIRDKVCRVHSLKKKKIHVANGSDYKAGHRMMIQIFRDVQNAGSPSLA